MGKTVGEWETYFEGLSGDFLTEVITALETLQKAEMIWDEYLDIGLPVLLVLARGVKHCRHELWCKEPKVAEQ